MYVPCHFLFFTLGYFPYLCLLLCGCPPCLFTPHSVPAILVVLQQASLITREECEKVDNPSYVVRIQSSKSPEVQTKTADVLRRHGLEEEFNLLAGKQTQSLIQVPVVCCTVEPSCKGHFRASIVIVSFTHTMLGHSE